MFIFVMVLLWCVTCTFVYIPEAHASTVLVDTMHGALTGVLLGILAVAASVLLAWGVHTLLGWMAKLLDGRRK